MTAAKWIRSLLHASLAGMVTMAHAGSASPLILGVVPQFTATETQLRWTPIIEQLQTACSRRIELQPSRSIPTFETGFLAGTFDLAYMNPYHAVMAQRAQGYIPLVRDNKKRLKGVLVVAADSPYRKPQDLQDQAIAFPAPNAFGASLLMRAVLEREEGVRFTPLYVKTHSNAYRHVLTGQAAAAGGVQATLQAESDDFRSQLRVLFETPPSAPHPLAAHPRVDEATRTCITNALLHAIKSPSGQAALDSILMTEPTKAVYTRDYAPLERLSLESYVVQTPPN
jgi:phosphonate transport system substrate-binding protein